MEEKVLSALKKVIDPEINVNIVDLGLVYQVKVKDGTANILMTLTSPACPLAFVFQDLVRENVEKVKGIRKVNIKLTFEPLWTPNKIKPQIRRRLGI